MSSDRLGVTRIVFVLGGVLLLTQVASAQDAGISGIVSDDTGGVLPGVTVTAASPALTEQQRIAITDGEGRYTFVQLRVGTYSVTFTLPGFNQILREGIELTSGFTANVSVDLGVGGIEETITVTGASPVVDIQNVRRQTTATAETLSRLPMSNKHVNNLQTITPGFTGLADVAGGYAQLGAFHGKLGTKVSVDGMGIDNSSGNSSYQINTSSVQEMVAQTSGISADTNADGAVVNIIPKEGGNTFRGVLTGIFSNNSMEGANLTPELEAQGLGVANRTLKLFDEGISLGGPIVRDKLWFFFAGRTWGFSRPTAGVLWNQSTAPGAPPTGQPRLLSPEGEPKEVVNWVPWLDRPDDRFSGRMEWYDSGLTRITWQASQNNKINFTYDEQRACNCGSRRASRAQEGQSGYRFDPNRLVQGTWTQTVSSRLLLEAGAQAAISQWNSFWMPGVEPGHVRIDDSGLGLRYGSYSGLRGDPNNTDRYSQRFSLSYVTGSHNFKAGFQLEQLVDNVYRFQNQNVNYRFTNGVPNRITMQASPALQRDRERDTGIYAQDQWTIDRLTLNLGVRFDRLYGWAPAQVAPGEPNDPDAWQGALRVNEWVGERSFERIENIPNWNDISPRLGVAYDLFGDGRTALKASLGRYVAKIGNEITQANNPFRKTISSVNRSWNDANENYAPDCDLGNFAANGECGAISNNNFGQNNLNAVVWDPDVLNGLRDNNWDLSTELQQELTDGLSVTVGYYWNNSGYNQQNSSMRRVDDNALVGAADYDEYCVTAPVDPRLPDGGGYEICGLYDINPASFGQSESVVTKTSLFGEVLTRNQFFNISFDGRLANGIQIGGGFDTGKTTDDRCFVVDSPQELLYCNTTTPFSGQTQFKAFGSVPLPYDFLVSFAYQNLSGDPYEADLSFPSAEIEPSLGRPLSSGGSRTVPLVSDFVLYGDRITRLDFRVSKIVNYNRFRFQVNLDAYNLANSSAPIEINSAFGSRWGFPNRIMDPRVVHVSGQIDF